MTKNNIIISQILIFFAITSFFLGFYLDEVPMGAGGYNGDFTFVLKSIDYLVVIQLITQFFFLVRQVTDLR